VQGKLCSICGERVLSSYAELDPDGLRRCPACRRVDLLFERAVAYGSYDGGLRELIHLLKYTGVRPAANVLGRMLAEALTSIEPLFEQATVLVVPVPLFKGKRRQREFNQAELIARAALKCLPETRPYVETARQNAPSHRPDGLECELPARECKGEAATQASLFRAALVLAPDLLVRTRDTHSQIGLTSHQRRANLRGAFALPRATEVTGCEVLLVDDVYTTGTTASECTRVLRRAGASKVWVATVARTLKLASNYEGFKDPEFQSFNDDQKPSEASELFDLETLKP
jgi:predicted amidophosphoribosyltransferase